MTHNRLKFFVAICLYLAITGMGSRAMSATLLFNPVASTIDTTDSIDIDIVISDLANTHVGGFDFSVEYDFSVLTFLSYELTENLGVIDADDPSAEAFDFCLGDLGVGKIHIGELSYLSDAALGLLQDGLPLTLATISFSGRGVGMSSLSFADLTISDASGGEVATEKSPGSIAVVAAPVPEPTSMLLFGTGLVGFACVRMRMKNG